MARGSASERRMADGRTYHEHAMVTLFLKSLGKVNMTLTNYRDLLGMTTGEEHDRIRRVIKSRFGIILPRNM